MIVRVGVAAAVVAVVLTGCTGDDDGAAPTVLPTVTTSSSPSPSVLPTPPAAASERTPDGAAAFVRFYIGLINEAYRTGASEPLRAYATDECDSCTSIADAVDDIYSDGGRAIGGILTINSLTPTGVAEGVQTSVVVNSAVSSYQELDLLGKVVDDVPAEQRSLLFDIDWGDQAWHVVGIRDPNKEA